MAEDVVARRPPPVGPGVDTLGAVVTVLANLVVGWVTWLPATFVVAGVVEMLHGEGSAGYTSDPDLVRPFAIAGAVLCAFVFVTVNLALATVLPGRRRWIWLVALVTFPVPLLIMQLSSR